MLLIASVLVLLSGILLFLIGFVKLGSTQEKSESHSDIELRVAECEEINL